MKEPERRSSGRIGCASIGKQYLQAFSGAVSSDNSIHIEKESADQLCHLFVTFRGKERAEISDDGVLKSDERDLLDFLDARNVVFICVAAGFIFVETLSENKKTARLFLLFCRPPESFVQMSKLSILRCERMTWVDKNMSKLGAEHRLGTAEIPEDRRLSDYLTQS